MQLFVRHRTTYRFDVPQRRLIQLARMTPPSFVGQTVLRWEIQVNCDARLSSARDGYGNKLTMLYVGGPVEQLDVEVAGEVLTDDNAGIVNGTSEPLPPLVFLRESRLTEPNAAIRSLAATAKGMAGSELEIAHALSRLVREQVSFDTSEPDVSRKGADSIERGAGVCQDFVHIFVSAARLLRLPARYVSGHLLQSNGTEQQSASHAWAEVWIADLGWVGFDPTNGVSPDDAYVRVAIGLDYNEAAPLVGARRGGGSERLDVSVTVAQASAQAQN